jgi:hypothetical protein
MFVATGETRGKIVPTEDGVASRVLKKESCYMRRKAGEEDI